MYTTNYRIMETYPILLKKDKRVNLSKVSTISIILNQ